MIITASTSSLGVLAYSPEFVLASTLTQELRFATGKLA
jgi:hypothetical protein